MGDLVKFLKLKKIGEVAASATASSSSSNASPSPSGLVSSSGVLVQALTSTPALEGFQLLIKNNILSIPLFDEKTNAFTSFLDILDVLYYLSEEGNSPQKLASTSCGSLANFSKLDPFIVITADTNLIKVLQISSQDYKSLHRFPVVDPETGKLTGIVSQSLLVRYLEPHSKSFDFGTLTVGISGIGLDKRVVTVNETDLVHTAIHKIKEHSISGVGIVDSQGKLVGNFDATGIKYFGIGDHVLDMNKSTLTEFLKALNLPKDTDYPAKVTKHTLIYEVILKFKPSGVHRVFVVDDHGKPIGIISLVDIIDLFFRHILIE